MAIVGVTAAGANWSAAGIPGILGRDGVSKQ